MGSANAYGLSVLARMSHFWGKGVPVLTTIAQVDNFANKKIYLLVIRLIGSYCIVGRVAVNLIDQLKWTKAIYFLFNDEQDPNPGARSEWYSLPTLKESAAMEEV